MNTNEFNHNDAFEMMTGLMFAQACRIFRNKYGKNPETIGEKFQALNEFEIELQPNGYNAKATEILARKSAQLNFDAIAMLV